MSRTLRSYRRLYSALALILAFVLTSDGAEPTTASKLDPAKLDQSIQRAVHFLQQAQADDGSFSASSGTGITAVVAAALLRSGRTLNDPLVAHALAYLERNRQEDGGIYEKGSRYKNYDCSLAVVAFQLANTDGRYTELLAAAEQFLKEHQWDEGEGIDVSNVYYGGAGYGGANNRPDLSNTSFLIDALHELGHGDDPAVKKALIFVSRCQNLKSEYNTTESAEKVNDGGFYYTIAAGGQSQAGKDDDGGLRSYGSMTYAGLKSMIYAGVSRDDVRVKAAYEWIRKHYTLEENPGMGPQGLFYYYHTFAKALAAMGEDRVTDSEGNQHDWRAELAGKLISVQNDDGSWINKNNRWFEGDPNLVTGYSLLALSYCR